MGSLGFYFNESACTGCRACQVACQDRNDMPTGYALRKVSSYTGGKYPHAAFFHYSAGCNHCGNAQCVENCPTGACQKAEDGTVFRDEKECIGCGSCVESCPYGHPELLDLEGISAKCDSCKVFRDNGLNPVCVDACCMRALEFGDIDELRATHEGEHLVNELPFLPSAAETGPSLLINAKEIAQSEDYKVTVI